MKIFGLLSKLTFHGRTVTDPDTGGVFFNWTCGGFTVAFSGKTLRARAEELISIAHPDFRDELRAEFRRRYPRDY